MERVILSIISLSVVSVGGFFLVKRIQEQRIATLVKNGQIVIDEESHNWCLSCIAENSPWMDIEKALGKTESVKYTNEYKPVEMRVYLRNKGEYRIEGNLVFLVTLSEKGLEEKFLKELLDHGGEDAFKKEVRKRMREGGELPPAVEAVYNYISRGKELPQKGKYEPMNYKNPQGNYTFKFREHVSLNPGEIIYFTHNEQIPLTERGRLLTIEVLGVEF